MLGLGIVLLGSAHAQTNPIRCVGERIERSSHTIGYAKRNGSDWRIEKSGRTVGYVRSRSSRLAIESSGSTTLGWLDKTTILKPNGSSWVRLDVVRRTIDRSCPNAVAAGLWVLQQADRF
ncbi:MAG: hypothetical protein AAGA48_37260 [Myxococcota bacterium]